jgi:molecular chaperone DnaK
MNNIVGLDLGTTFSAIARINSIGKPEIVPLEDAQRVIASAIYFDDSKTLVGEVAINMSEVDNSRFADIFKRYMGEEFYPKEIMGKKWKPVELSAILLAKMKADFEIAQGPMHNCVITVPAYFDEIRRKATMDAAKKAGLEIKLIVNEPSAAGLYYATELEIEGKIIVFDLGGGTFDVTLLDVTRENKHVNVDIVCSNGDSSLGGKDFDRIIAKDIEKMYEEKYGKSYANGKGEYVNHLMRIAETLKKTLSKMTTAKTIIQGDLGSMSYDISRDRFEQMIAGYFAKIEMLIETVLEEGKIETDEIDSIILVGGSSRIPLVEKTIESMFGKKPLKVGNMDECVALGAAIYAGLDTVANRPETISKDVVDALKNTQLNEKCNHGYGTVVVALDEVLQKQTLQNSILIPKNSKIPISVTKTFYTISKNQTKIDLTITQGESVELDEVNTIKKAEMELPPNRESNKPIEITYAYDQNQRMHCTFRDVESDRVEEFTLQTNDLEDNDESDLDLYFDF